MSAVRKRTLISALGGFAIMCLHSTPSVADSVVIELREWKAANASQKAELIVYVSGIYEGLAWANATLEAKGLPRLFCPPQQLAMTRDQVASILDHHVESRGLGTGDRAPIAFTLQMALEEVFPCELSDE